MQENKTNIQPSNAEERPPLFRRWRGWYIFVLFVLVILILLFYLFTKHFA